MSAAEAQAEPTMEEILASIRKIISEDEVAPSDEPMPDADVDNFGDDVLELTQEQPIEEVAAPEPEPIVDDFEFDEPAPEPEPIFEAEEEIIVMDREPEPVYIEPEPVAYAPMPTIEPKPLEATIGLIGAQTAEAAAAAFSKVGPALPGHFSSGASVEELVSYLLKPMLKEWLDQHLPRIVEERVEAELARIARRGF